MFSRQNRLFNCCLIGLAMWGLVTMGLFIVLASQLWEAEQEFRAKQDELRQNQALWQSQNIASYTVQYTNCNGTLFCCTNATLTATDHAIDTLPACATNSYGIFDPATGYWGGYYYVSSVDDTFLWIAEWMEEYRNRDMTLRYDPVLGYITYIEVRAYESGPKMVIEYQALARQ